MPNPPFRVTRNDALVLSRPAQLSSDFILSPYVWRDGAAFRMLARVVNDDPDPDQKVARIYYATSSDGLAFAIEDTPVIAPSEIIDDDGGCEDPTVLAGADGYRVYYSGWSRERRRSTLLCAAGATVRALRKEPGPVIAPEHYANAKEATAIRGADGYRLFFEYAKDGASKIGHVVGPGPRGPFEPGQATLEARSGQWDPYHLSAGPIVDLPLGPVMFYNGADEKAHWRIGWAVFDRQYTAVVARSDEPLVTPEGLIAGGTDIAFAASVVLADDGTILLYYSVSDAHLMRATIEYHTV